MRDLLVPLPSAPVLSSRSVPAGAVAEIEVVADAQGPGVEVDAAGEVVVGGDAGQGQRAGAAFDQVHVAAQLGGDGEVAAAAGGDVEVSAGVGVDVSAGDGRGV